ncbi:type I-E CRISPR-associated protein Cse2/CasB [Actinacidiphila paucisporea]|uniref:CRISPR system Cascade subunit CasB n=1 Tax=Actinacidiphila paucisporea TaxID=310782 RepID=A0A1M6TKE4_9ACTN|nr:type I-E CRISPR-associated protein Cse2/CasB [Actinacidiphila paucisporea]SHK57248.1 CRISPR system Cascade subunit CasB [Actinacidiphila paucisporea]
MTTNTAAASPTARGHRDRGPVADAADRCIKRLQYGYRQDHPSAVSTLARLRRGAGRPAHDVQDLWGLTATDELSGALALLPEDEQRRFDHDRAEEALHLAVTLWALHQQSHREADMYLPGRGLGRAVRILMIPLSGGAESAIQAGRGDEGSGARAEPVLDEPLRRRFVRVGTSSSFEDLAQRLREIVLLLRRSSIGLDYALLADQLYRWQQPDQRAEVRRGWGRDFHLAGIARGANAPQG